MTFKAFLPIVCLFLAACAQPLPSQTTPEPVPEQAPPTADSSDAPHYSEQTLAQLEAAKRAAEQGKPRQALAIYIDQAYSTGDPALIEQAARLALYMRQTDTALQLGQLLLKQQPNSLAAWRISGFAHLLQGQTGAAKGDIAKQLAQGGPAALDSLLAYGSKLPQAPRQLLFHALSDLTERFPEMASLWLAKALNMQRLGRPQDALAACDRLLALNPTSLDGQLLKAQLLVQLQRPDAARTQLKALVNGQPASIKASIAYIKLLLRQQRSNAAIDAMEDFAQRFPERRKEQLGLALFALQQDDSKSALPSLQSLLQQGFRPDETRYYLARAFEMQQDWAAAATHFLGVEGRRLLQARVAAARIYYQQQQPGAGAQLFSRLRILHPKEAASLYAAEASLLIEQHDLKALKPLLDSALAAYPQDADLRYMRAMTAGREGQYQASIEQLEALLADHPNDATVLNALGYTLSNHSQRYQEAWYYIKRAHARQPDNPAIQDSLGWVLYRLGRYQKALPLLQSAYDTSHDKEVASHLLQALKAAGKAQQVEQRLSDVRRRFPDGDWSALLQAAGATP